ncbi:N-acetylglucosamine kinase [Leifsonia sp. Root227]|uniref:N-acetylglucosamine kinase n=1 Tax=Leifsonia sp. Root227 TaxID=1736496 RepID=UPI0019108CFD|nr:BadF/BadG/BcrA/BcrD ATPase family protein [Leifsonia sp. Root227]
MLGIDAGGTKIHLRASASGGELLGDVIVPSEGWTSLDAAGKADVIVELIASSSFADPAAVGIGAHGCDSDAECEELRSAIAVRSACAVEVVNDAVLLQHTVDDGTDRRANLVLGTGSIVVAKTPDGKSLYAGGWGWLVGDPGSAWGVVRESIRRLTEESDAGRANDPLRYALLRLAGVHSLRGLVEVLHRLTPSEWAAWAPAVFEAAEAGSAIARATLEDGAQRVVDLVRHLRDRGAAIDGVVAGGGVIANQPMLELALSERLREQLQLELVVVREDPVRGAVRLALSLLAEHAPAAI